MKKFLITFAALVFVIGLVSSSNAVSFTDTTLFTPEGTNPGGDLVSYGYGTVNKLDGLLDYVCWTHHFEFVPPFQEVLSRDLTVWLQDDDRDPCCKPFEFALGWAEDGTWDFGEVDTGPYTYSVTGSSLIHVTRFGPAKKTAGRGRPTRSLSHYGAGTI